MKRFNKKRLILSGLLVLLVIVLLILLSSDIFTYSKYEKNVTSQNSLVTAVYLLDDEYQVLTVKLPDVIPDNNQYAYTFSVSNFNDDAHCDTNLKYKIHVRTTTNLEIDYEIYNTLDITNASSAIISNTITADRNGTFFRHIYTDEKTMLFTEDKTEYYTILFTFPDDYKAAKYSGIPELIEINVESRQIMQTDS